MLRTRSSGTGFSVEMEAIRLRRMLHACLRRPASVDASTDAARAALPARPLVVTSMVAPLEEKLKSNTNCSRTSGTRVSLRTAARQRRFPSAIALRTRAWR